MQSTDRSHAAAHLELLAEVDSLMAELAAWASRAPDWPAARQCQALIARLEQRAQTLRVRLDAPLVVATLGGTGTGKSTLVNALVGSDVTEAGRQRPTTRKPVLICRGDITPELLSIDPASVQVVHREAPLLRDVVLLDCPDPDTTEDPESAGTNLDRLRHLLPHCDVLLVTSTQQKYRSARVAEELATAAPGARLVFVQTHADTDEDIRPDWRRQLADEYAVGEIFYLDSVQALADARSGLAPRGEFARLLDLLTRELAGTAQARIRRANFLDLVEETLALCRQRLDAALPAVDQLEAALAQQRGQLSRKLAESLRDELLSGRRQWERRLLAEVTSRWGFSPFSLVLRGYQGLGAILSGAALWRVRTPVQMALWGAVEGGRALRRRTQEKHTEAANTRAVAWSWDESQLRAAALALDGYAAEAGVGRDPLRGDDCLREAAQAGTQFIEQTSGQLQSLVARQAGRHCGWFTRMRYELALLVMLGLVLYRLGRNFFWDSWLAVDLGFRDVPASVLGLDFFVPAVFWLLVWCAILVWAFTSRLRRGLKGQINQLAQQWMSAAPASLFAGLEARCRDVRRYSDDQQRLATTVAVIRAKIEQPEVRLGQRIVSPRPRQVAVH